jgi:hypothetical protein
MLQAVDACMSWVNNRAEGHAPLTVQAPGEMLGIYNFLTTGSPQIVQRTVAPLAGLRADIELPIMPNGCPTPIQIGIFLAGIPRGRIVYKVGVRRDVVFSSSC